MPQVDSLEHITGIPIANASNMPLGIPSPYSEDVNKIVFEIAWEDYLSAAESGYVRAKSRADFLYENNITTTSDWFMISETGDQLMPKGECYSWINRSIKRKK